MIVETIEKLEEGFNDKVLIDIIGGSITELFFKKSFSYIRFERQPKKFEDDK